MTHCPFQARHGFSGILVLMGNIFIYNIHAAAILTALARVGCDFKNKKLELIGMLEVKTKNEVLQER